MWQPESLILIILCIYSQGADRRGAGDLDGDSGPPGTNFHPFFLWVFSGRVFFRPGFFSNHGSFQAGGYFNSGLSQARVFSSRGFFKQRCVYLGGFNVCQHNCHSLNTSVCICPHHTAAKLGSVSQIDVTTQIS